MTGNHERRELSFTSLADAVADAQRLAAGEVRTTGNHSFGQILEHLAITLDMASGKTKGPKFPWFMRLAMPFLKKGILNNPLEPGFSLPRNAETFFWPDKEFDVQAALAHLEEAVDHFQTKGPLAVHPVFGKATTEQIVRLNVNHCALHLSFVHPA